MNEEKSGPATGPAIGSAKYAMPISAVEMQEYLFSVTAAKAAKRAYGHESDPDNSDVDARVSDSIREAFRFMRFGIINWLLMNGVSIPPDLLSDEMHPQVGRQYPDRTVDKACLKAETDR